MAALPPGYRLDVDGEVVRRESRLEQWNRKHYPERSVRTKEVSMATKESQAVMMAKVLATPIPCVDCGQEFTRRSPIQKRCAECAARRLKEQRKGYNAKARKGGRTGNLACAIRPPVPPAPRTPLVSDPPAQDNNLLGLAKALLRYDAEARRRAEELAALREAQVRRAIELANQIVRREED